MNSPSGPSRGIDEVAESFVAQCRAGVNPSIEDYKRRYPELAEEIDEVLPTLAMLEACHADPASEATIHPDQTPPSRIGDYRIVQEIGRGGMGIVYEAEHESMQRRVALKLLSASQAKRTNQLTRFYREARSAGQLHHSNIVPVFEVGSADGLHYYTMQFIRGQSLDLVIDEIRQLRETSPDATAHEDHRNGSESLSRTVAVRMVTGNADRQLPGEYSDDAEAAALHHQEDERSSVRPTRRNRAAQSSSTKVASVSDSVFESAEWSSGGSAKQVYFRRVAAVGMQVADALGYAHHNGVLHRDIKPANLILDTDGTVWVLDFGLAKSEEEGLTHSGDIVGTLRYMAPERFHGQADARSDVYSLGLTLYELCTLGHAFDETDRVSLLKQVVSRDPRPPRQIDPSIPLDLETIILKAIDRDSNRRYKTATQLAEDLQLFLMDHPVKARRISSVERFWRICRRNPVLASMTACIVSLLVLVAFGASWFAYVSDQQKQRAVGAERRAIAASNEARLRNYELSYERAEAGRWSGRPGQHFDTLASITEAVRILPSLGFSSDRVSREQENLRNAAIAAMPLVDVQVERVWDVEGDWTHSVCFSHDYQRFAQSNTRGDIRIVDVDGESPELRIASPGERAWTIEFSPDGKFLFSRHHDVGQPFRPQVFVWSLDDTSEPVIEITDDVIHAQGHFSAHDRVIAIARRDRVELYSLPEGDLWKSLPVTFEIDRMQFAHDRPWIAVAERYGKIVEIWDYSHDTSLIQRIELNDNMMSLGWDAERELLVTGMRDGSVLVWSRGYDLPPVRHRLHQSPVTRVKIHPHQPRIVTQAWDNTSRILDFAAGVEELRIEGCELTPTPFSRDSTRLSFTREQRKFGIWRFPESPLHVLEQDVTSATSTTRQVHLHPMNSQLAVTSNSARIEFWNVTTRRRLHSIEGQESVYVGFSTDGQWFYISGKHGFQRYPLRVSAAGSQLQLQLGDPETLLTQPTRRFDLRADGQVAVVALESNSVLLDLSDKSVLVRFGRHPAIATVAISNDGRWVATGTWRGYGVRVWDATTGQLVQTLIPKSVSSTIRFSPDGKVLVAADGDSIYLWQCESWQPIEQQMQREANGIVGRLRFSADGRLLAADKTRYLPQLISFSDHRSRALLEAPHPEKLHGYSFSADQSWLAVGGDFNSFVWNLANVRSRLRKMNLDWD